MNTMAALFIKQTYSLADPLHPVNNHRDPVCALLPMLGSVVLLYLLAASSLVHAQDKPVNVSVMPVEQIAYFPQGSAPATAVSLNDTTLSAQIQSSIDSISVMVADVVDKGDVLVKLDCRSSLAKKQSNQEQLSLAEYLLQRVSKLSKDKHVSEELLRKRQSERVIARSALTVSATDVERCTVVAPFRGVVTQRLADVGEWVNLGEPLLQLVDLDHVEVSARLPDLAISELESVRQFDFVAGDRRFPVKLRKISEVVDETSRTRELRLTFADNSASPGQSGRLVWQQTQHYLPASYLASRDNRYGVFIINDKHARFFEVPDAQEGRPVRIDLPPGSLVIDKGRYFVKDGDAVAISR
jgi:RND family efflux transporter MFP subunit